MPKLKTKRALVKRFRITKSGKVKKAKCFRGHLLTKKSRARKRRLRKPNYAYKTEAKTIKRLMPYG